MEKRFNPEKLARLDSLERKKALPPETILALLDIKKSDTILDLGAGTGYFTLPASTLCHQVYALDVSPLMLQHLQEKIAEQETTNVELLEGKIEQIPVESQAADHIIASFVIHEVEPLQDGLKEIQRVLKAGGKVLCIEWEKKQMEQGPPLEHRLHSSELSQSFEEHGFTIEQISFPNEQHYVIIARKQG
ncbi:class I SAM-dependent methyltransferase [Paenibacillus sp. 37]|uniref:class I SAM-dependent methyltransferase n=1 Tax=Paenibacillus sp. 37 TaxID=2607911 RepID=UPI001CB75D02|nr:class I SAM-dependent methyltransferase [Paenibacillus sp. 37]